jgi:glycoside/pentoside/hexuronide:cation symporter, GPH family
VAEELTRRRLLGYGIGSVGTGIVGALPGLLLLIFLTDTLGVPAGWAGLILLVPKAWDVVLNPIVGAWSDRTTAGGGTRTPWLLAGSIGVPVLFAAMFAVPVSGVAAGAGWVAVAFLLATTAYSLYHVNYVALPAEMTDDPRERTRIMTPRIVLLTVGILIAGGLGPALSETAGGGRVGGAPACRAGRLPIPCPGRPRRAAPAGRRCVHCGWSGGARGAGLDAARGGR